MLGNLPTKRSTTLSALTYISYYKLKFTTHMPSMVPISSPIIIFLYKLLRVKLLCSLILYLQKIDYITVTEFLEPILQFNYEI